MEVNQRQLRDMNNVLFMSRLSHLYSYYLRQLLDSTLNPWILFYQLSDLDVLIGNGTTETGYVVATSKMAARKMVLQYLLTIN